IPLIGPKAQERLARFGLRAVRDVVPHDRETLVGWLGEREGAWLHERARGIDRAPVEANRETKSVSRDETFATDLDDDGALAAKLLALADRASADVREAGLIARTVTVKLREADFTTRQASRTLADAVQSDRAVSRRPARPRAPARGRPLAARPSERRGPAVPARIRRQHARDRPRPGHLSCDRRGAREIWSRRPGPRWRALTASRDGPTRRLFSLT